jgi:eukaryotic-like serine/threonine-protein kinase
MSETGSRHSHNDAADAGSSDEPASRPSAEDAAAFDAAGYRISGMLGLGGFGTVWEATRHADGAIVAIKTVRRDNWTGCQRLRLEAAVLRAMAPPHVPALYDEGELPDGAAYFVFERLTVPSLATRVEQAPLALEWFFELAAAILESVGAAHDRGFLHRDLKPDNIFVSDSPARATLIDFGLAKSLPGMDTAGADQTIADTSEGMVLGTPLYMSPEQCEGRAQIDARADIYALGVVFYEMLTGHVPFAGDSAQVRIAHIGRRPPPPSRFAPVPQALEEVVLRCLAKLPERRPGSAAALAYELERVRSSLASQPARARPDSAAAASPAPAARAPVLSGQQFLAGLLFFEAETDTATVQRALEARGGRLVSVAGKRCIAAFGLDTADNPVERSLSSAQALFEQGVALRITVDRARVSVYRGRDGSRRILPAALHRSDRFARATDPPGILLTAASVSSVAQVETAALPGRDDVHLFIGHRLAREHGDALVGREELVRELVAGARHAAAHSQPAIATVLAEAGHGKSHLAAAVVEELRRSGVPMRAIQIRARAPLEGDNDYVLRQLLLAALGLLDSQDAGLEEMEDHGRGLLCQRLGAGIGEEVWPAVALILGWLSAEAPEVRRLSAAPAALRAAAARAAGEALKHLAENTLVCCIVDDAHFADETALDALEYATLAEANVRLWVCALADPSFARARPHWAGRAACSQRVHMEALSQGSAMALCRRLLEPAQNIPESVLSRLVAETQGNPLLLTELARAIKRHGLIRQHARGDTWFLAVDELDALPDLPRVEWLADKELGALPEELASHARLMALLAAEFTAAEVEGVLRAIELDGLGEAFPLDAWVAVQRLLERGLLMRQGGEQVEFRHEVIREQVARSIPEALSKRLHRAAYHYYLGASAIAGHRRLPLVAYHAARSGVPEAAAMYLDLADRARQRHEYLDAQIRYSRALELMEPVDRARAMQAHKGRGLMRYRLSRFADALDDLRRAREIAGILDDAAAQAELLLDEATVLDWTSDFQASLAMVEQAEALIAQAPTLLLQARLALGLGRARFRRDAFGEAITFLEQAAAQAEALGDEGYETLVIALMLLGWSLASEGHRDRADAVFARSVALCEGRGDKLHLAAVLNNRRELRMAQKDVAGTLSDLLLAQRIGREIGQIGVEFATAFNLAELYYFIGDIESSRRHLARAAQIEPSSSRRPISLLLEARLSMFSGELERARGAAATLEAMQAEARARGDVDALFAESEEIFLAVAALSTVNDPAGWIALEQRALSVPELIARVEVLELIALHHQRAGRIEQAARLYHEALACCASTPTLLEERIRGHLAGSA